MVTVSSRLPYVVDTQPLRDTTIIKKMKLQYRFTRPMKKPGLELRCLLCKSLARSTEAQTSSKAAVNTSGTGKENCQNVQIKTYKKKPHNWDSEKVMDGRFRSLPIFQMDGLHNTERLPV